MTRLVLFLSLMVGIVCVLSLRFFQGTPVQNERFDLKKASESYALEQKDIERMTAPKTEEEEGGEVSAPVEKVVSIPLDTPELQNGAKVYAQCVVCHGKNGEGKKSQKAPYLAGQYDWYLYSQLVSMKSKKRVNEVMDPYLKKLSDQDMKDVALLLSKYPWP